VLQLIRDGAIVRFLVQMREEIRDPTCFAPERADVGFDAGIRPSLGKGVLEVRRTLCEIPRVHAGEAGGAVAVGYVSREQRAFAGDRVDRVAVLAQRMAIDGAPVTAGEGGANEEWE
jgi:hypothetical protein